VRRLAAAFVKTKYPATNEPGEAQLARSRSIELQ